MSMSMLEAMLFKWAKKTSLKVLFVKLDSWEGERRGCRPELEGEVGEREDSCVDGRL